VATLTPSPYALHQPTGEEKTNQVNHLFSNDKKEAKNHFAPGELWPTQKPRQSPLTGPASRVKGFVMVKYFIFFSCILRMKKK